MRGAILVAAAVGAAAPGAVAQTTPAYHYLLLDCARYRQSVHSVIQLESTGERSRETTDRDGILRLRAAPRDSLIALEAWFDSLALVREGSGEKLVPDTDGILGGRYLGLLAPLGGFTSTDTPFVPDDVAQVADVSDALAELLPPLPPRPLAPGAGARDAFGTVHLRLPDGVRDGRSVQRYRLTRRLDRLEERPLPDSTMVRAERHQAETGTWEWSPELGLVRWERSITIEVVVPTGGPVKRAFRTGISQEVTVERLPTTDRCE